ncbi:MAG: AAA family ATPase [Pseudomonadota bacterium]
MYQEFFRLHESPFSLDPDPRFLYLSPAHATARAYLDYTVESRDGMVVLTGHAGCGKSILVADLCRRVDRADMLLLDQTQLDSHELLQTLLLALGQDSLGDRPQLHARLREVLCERIEQGRRTTLIVDEAQHLSWEALETLRMVADQQHQGRRVLAVILVGQLGLARTLKSEGLEQFRQRIRLFYTLEPLARQEIRRYLEHRLAVAGGHHDVIISPRALKIIKRYTGGIPRLINTLMDMVLTAAALERTRMISARLVQEAARELQWEPFFLRHGRLFFGDRARELARCSQAVSNNLKPLMDKLRKAVSAQMACMNRVSGRVLDRIPTQWMAGLSGAALVLVPAALLLPAWLEGSRIEERQSILPLASVEADATAAAARVTPLDGGTLEPIKASAIKPARSKRNAPIASAPTPVALLPAPTPQPRAKTPTALPADPATRLPNVQVRTPRIANAASDTQTLAPSPKRSTPTAPAAPTTALRDARWLLQQPGEAYSVQLFAASSPEGIQRFLDEHGQGFRGDRELAAFTAHREGSPWHVLVLATYATYSDTRAAIGKLPAPLRKHQPWVRQIAVIHEAIREETRQAGTTDGRDRLVAGTIPPDASER